MVKQIKSLNMKLIYIYDKSGNLLFVVNSQKEAAEASGYSITEVSQRLSGRRTNQRNLVFSYCKLNESNLMFNR